MCLIQSPWSWLPSILCLWWCTCEEIITHIRYLLLSVGFEPQKCNNLILNKLPGTLCLCGLSLPSEGRRSEIKFFVFSRSNQVIGNNSDTLSCQTYDCFWFFIFICLGLWNYSRKLEFGIATWVSSDFIASVCLSIKKAACPTLTSFNVVLCGSVGGLI